MTKLLHRGILCVLLGLFVCNFNSVHAVNLTTTVTWPFSSGAAGQVGTYTTGTENYFSVNWVSLGSNLAYKDKSTNYTINYTRFQPATQVTSADANDVAAFCIRPATGIIFTPTSISFDCMRYGTDGGSIDVVWKSGDGTITTIATAIKPNRDNSGAGTHASYTLSSIPAASGDCMLYVYIYNLGNTKQMGLANIVVNGNLTGDLITVTKYAFNTTVYPSVAGTVNNSPVGTSFDQGTSLTVTATRNFGYQFKEWHDANTDALVSTANPYTFTLNSDVSLKAVYNTLNTYSLTLNTSGGAPNYMISATPAGTPVNGQTMYEAGTTVNMTASNNQLLTFTNWLTGETNSTKTVSMTQNQNITAVYSAVDYIVGWDFYNAGGSSRPADFYSTTDNQTSVLVLRKADGTINSWLDKSIVAANGYYGPGAAVNWKPVADQNYYQINFTSKDFTNVKVSAGLLYNYNAYSVQKCDYSLDGTNFTTLGTYTLTAGQTWFSNTFALPADADHADKVYVRWIPDYTSALVGTTAIANDGTAISNIYVTATAAIYNDGLPPVLSSSVPAASATNASSTGSIVLTFNKKVALTSGSVTATLGSKTLTPAVSGTTITFPYTGLDYNTQFTFTLPTGSVADLAGNLQTSPITITFTTMTRPVVTKKGFDFVVGVDGNFSAAIAAATTAQSSGNRFRIFFPNGQYNIGGATTADANQMTTITLPNVSYIGQSSSGVSLYNLPTTEGIGVTATIHLTSTANNIYMQDLTLLNNYPYAQTTGRAVALWDQGTENIYKNVNVLSNQDTYYSGSGKCYFEGGSIHGTVDFICGGGDIFFNKCLLYLENRTGNNITAPATTSNWGYVFSNCTIDGYACTNGNYSLGRPWQNSPKSVYINTIMNVLPSASGWTTMGSVVQALFAEYNSTTPSGAPVDLSSRMTTYTYNGVSTPVNPILTANQAATYTIDNVLGGTDAWQPELYTDQATIPVISGNGTAISWADNNYVSCWVIFKDGVYVTTTTTNSYAIPTSTTTGTYTVCAANEMGGLSAVSNSYAYSYVATGINTPDSRSKIIEQRFYTVDGKKVLTLNGFKGIFIVCSIYADGHVETSKITKTDY